MKRFLQIVAWTLGRVVKFPGNVLSFVVRLFTRVHKGRIVCWAHNFKQYGCNPRYLTEYLMAAGQKDVWWVFRRGVNTSEVDPRVKVVRFRSWRYFLLMATAEVFITNARTDPYHIYWHKRQGQRYAMLWHAGVALKRIEGDALDGLGYSYLRKARRDSQICDLMISGSRMHSDIVRRAFWYDGEIMECGLPRNDIFFDVSRHASMRRAVCRQYGIAEDSCIVLYAPTFRHGASIEPYRLDWSRVRRNVQRMYGTEAVTVLVRLHPNLLGRVDTSALVAYEGVVDATRDHDMQRLLCASDMLITDYSSAMFDFSMLRRPCMLYATDADSYDRGFYFDIHNLPYPLATSEERLLDTIANFDMEAYLYGLDRFFAEDVGLCETGAASEALARWIARK